MHANPDENLASEQPLPRVFGIILLVCVHQHWPLITADRHFTTRKFFMHAKRGRINGVNNICKRRNTDSASFQSTPAGQRRAPVAGWW
jgi:hypothetical protein